MYLEKNSFSHLRMRLQLRLKIVLLDLLEFFCFQFICSSVILIFLILSLVLTMLLQRRGHENQKWHAERE